MAARTIRPIRVEGNVAYIPLTKGYEAIIDAADVPLVEGWNWTAFTPQRKTVYAVRTAWRGDRWGHARLHREIMGSPDGVYVDHIDGNGLNNRRRNLRLATHAENQRNAALRVDNRSGFKGVFWYAATAKWVAKIQINGASKHLGYFDSAEAAHAAYCAAADLFHGEFARTS